MTTPSYPAARLVSTTVEAHFARRATETAATVAETPDAQTIETMIDVAFWASLRREEGRLPTISLAYVSPGHAGRPLVFERGLPLSPAALAKLAPAVKQPGMHLGVWRDTDDLKVWGTTRSLPPHCFVIEVVGSGLLVVKHRGGPFGKFINVAVLEGDEIKIVDERPAAMPNCPGVLKSMLGFEAAASSHESVNVLVQLSAAMRLHGRGGALLVVPRESDWRESIVPPVLYSLSPPMSELADLMDRQREEIGDHDWQDEFRHAVVSIAGLTAVDGATVINDRYDVLAFGAKITRRRGRDSVERVTVTEPIEGTAMTTMTPSQLGGTRHFSAAQFVHDQRDAIALVASQDGRFTIFRWAPEENMVHAHRVEALLL